MPTDFGISEAQLLSFLLVLARVSATVALVPIPGWRRGPDVARIMLALSLTFVLLPLWPAPPKLAPTLAEVTGWVCFEVMWGGAIGLGVTILMETFLLAAQCVGLQAGFSYASTVDPNSEADTTVLQLIAQLTASLLFFALHLDAEIIRVLARSLTRHPPGTWANHWPAFWDLTRLGTEMWRTALRVAIPLLALLLMLDLAVALYGKIQPQVQLMTLAFPLKILVSLAALAMFTAALPAIFRQQAAIWLSFAGR